MTILLLDDEEVVRRFAAAALNRAGYEVLEASATKAALAIAGEFQGEIPLLITNHRLHDGKTGRQVAEELMTVRPSMRVLHISGYPERILREEGSITPGGQYLGKPFHAAALVAKVKAILKDSAH